MELMNLTRENFDTVIASHPMVLVDFWAHWCGPCRVFGEVYETISEKYPDILFGKVNIEEELELAQDFHVRSIPMLMIFRDNIAVYAESGALTASALEEVIQKARGLDLSEVKKMIDAAEQNDQ